MKRYLPLTLLIALSLPLPALAQDMRDCEAQSAGIDSKKRDAFLKSCLAQASAPANVKETVLKNKRQLCEQNARNLALKGDKKTGYIDNCLTWNEAEAAANKVAPPSHERAYASGGKPANPSNKLARQQDKSSACGQKSRHEKSKGGKQSANCRKA